MGEEAGLFSKLTELKRCLNSRTATPDLENHRLHKNLKLMAGDVTSLTDFLQSMLWLWVRLLEDFPLLEIEHAHRALAPTLTPNHPPRSILVLFLHLSERVTILRSALKNATLSMRVPAIFSPDLSAEVLWRRPICQMWKAVIQLNIYCSCSLFNPSFCTQVGGE